MVIQTSSFRFSCAHAACSPVRAAQSPRFSSCVVMPSSLAISLLTSHYPYALFQCVKWYNMLSDSVIRPAIT